MGHSQSKFEYLVVQEVIQSQLEPVGEDVYPVRVHARDDAVVGVHVAVDGRAVIARFKH